MAMGTDISLFDGVLEKKSTEVREPEGSSYLGMMEMIQNNRL